MNTLKGMLKRIEKSQKTYNFSDLHNPRIPADFWFQNPPEGLTLFVVFYTLACQWAQCLGCNLPSVMSQHKVSFVNIMKQIDYVFEFLLSQKQLVEIKKIILSNNGSILDEETFSTTALMYFIAKMNMFCPNIQVFSIESRVEYVDWEELKVLSRALNEGASPTDLEIAIGFEAFDEKIRNEYFHKGLALETFENMAKMIAEYGFKLKIYFMLKPVPQISEAAAVEDIHQGINYLDSIANKYNIDINMHLNPTYVAKGTRLETEFYQNTYTPPLLDSLRKAALSAEGKNLSLFLGLNDEGLSVPGGSFIREGDEALLYKMEEFNHSQNFKLLK